MRAVLRSLRGIVALAFAVAIGIMDLGWTRVRHGRLSRRQRAYWLSRTCDRTLRFLRVEAEYRGRNPAAGMVVANHLSYLDILIISAQLPCVFVSKDDVRSWPLFGWCAQLAGTVFIDRRRRTDTSRVAEEIATLLAHRMPIVVFPEGTSSDGSTVLPFHASLLEPAVAANQPITPAYIDYEVSEGSAAVDVCYWGDMTLLPHLVKLLSKRKVTAHLSFGEPAHHRDRKQAAQDTRAEVIALGDNARCAGG